MMFCQINQILAIGRLAQLFPQILELLGINPTVTPSNFLDTAHIHPLTVLYGSHEIRGIQQTVAIARIEPGETTSENLYLQRAFIEIQLIKVGNLILTTGRRL